ncbi:MAG: acetate--CoA ligase family protein, partial [Mycobacterium leprae]
KPVVALKVGRTGQGSDAAKSHTGALAGADQIYDGAFRQYGLIRANRLDDFTVMLQAFDRLPLPKGARVAVITNAGGPGVYSLDALSDQGLALGHFSAETRATLATILPPFASIGHPDGHVDTTGGVVPSQVARTVATILRDPGIDAVIHLFIPTKFTPAVETAQELLNLLPEVKQNGLDKPFFPVFMSGKGVEAARQLLESSGLPSFGSPDQVAVTLGAMVRYSREQQQPATAAMNPPESVSALPALERLTATCRAEGRTQLTEWETYEALRAFQIPVAPSRLVSTPAEAAEAAKALGGRVAVKIVSPDIGHKTDAGCVRLGLTSPEATSAAAAEILANAQRYKADAAIHGLLVQQMAAPGVELITGGLADATFGPVLMVGLGGIFTEVLKDVAFRLAPISPAEAETMLRSLKGFPLLTGVRGKPPVAIAPLAQAIANLSRLLAAWPELKELDLNPLIATAEGVVAVDGLATLRG